MTFADISFKRKILLILALPVIGFLWLSITSTWQSIIKVQQMALLSQLTKLSVINSELIDELQKERGLSAGFLGSSGGRFTTKLASQREQTNKKIAQWESYINHFPVENIKIAQLNQNASLILNNLVNVRNKVDANTFPLLSTLDYFTQLNKVLLSVNKINIQMNSETFITKEIIAYYYFLQGKENAGLERAILLNSFTKGVFGEGMYIRFVELLTLQQEYFNHFIFFTTPKNINFFQESLNGTAITEVMKMRYIAKQNTNIAVIAPFHWFEQASQRIKHLKNVEDSLAVGIVELADNTKNESINMMLFNLFFTSILALLSVVVGFFTVRDLSARVTDLTSVLVKVRSHSDLTLATRFTDHSELGKISLALNLTLKQFSQVIEEIVSFSIRLATAAEETSQTCDHNSMAMLEQRNGISLIAIAIEELSISIKEVAKNTQLTANSAKQANLQAQNGLETVKKSCLSIDTLAQEVDNLAMKIKNLHLSSEKITNVVDVIKSVAEQTNLLALNAAIEAARAGEQGRGFAVVADEVRSLAQRTQDSTGEIEELISALQLDVLSAFSVIESSQSKSITAVKEAKVVEDTLDNIIRSIRDIFSMTEEVATAIEQQVVVAQKVTNNVVTIEQKSMESTTGATQIAVTAKEQAKLAIGLEDIAKIFKI